MPLKEFHFLVRKKHFESNQTKYLTKFVLFYSEYLERKIVEGNLQ
jgi:hypothetical protein